MKKNIFKRILISLCLVLTLGFCLQGTNYNFNNFKLAYAAENNLFTNGDFSNPSSGSSNPFKPNNFTRVGVENDNIKAGIVYLDQTNFDKYKEEYGLTGSYNLYLDNGVSPDNKALLINNKNTVATTSGDKFTLNANRYYKLTLYARSVNGGLGSIVLRGENNDNAPLLYSSKIITRNNWTIYKFFIETNKHVDTTATLSLWLGDGETTRSLGGVMYDSISLTELTQAVYNSETKNETSENVIDLTGNEINKVNTLLNPTFEDELNNVNRNNWTFSNEGNANRAEIMNLQSSIDQDIIPGDYKKSTRASYGLVMYAKESGYASATSDEFIIKQNDVLELRFYAKLSSGTNATANIVTTEFLKNDEKVEYGEKPISASLTINATDNDKTNNYGLYRFIIKGNYYFDTKVKIELSLGSSSSKTSGYVVFDDFSSFRLNSSLVDSLSSSANTTTINLYNGSSDGNVTNNNFNFADTIEFSKDYQNIIYPIANVTGFEKSTFSESNSVSGIIDVNDYHFRNHYNDYGTTKNPQSPSIINNANPKTTANNVLLIRNIGNGYTTFTSKDSKTLASNSYYKISAYAYRDTAESGSGYIKILDSNKNVLASLPVTEEAWQKKEIYISTGFVDSTSISIALCLGDEANKASGNVYFDLIDYVTSTEDEYKNAKENQSKNILAIDLSTETFDNVGALVEGEHSLYTTAHFTLDENHSEYAKLGVYKDSPVGHSSNELTSILMLSNTHEGISSATSNKNFSVESDKYYKLSVFAKITGITSDTTDDEYGAFIGLKNYEAEANRFINLKDTKDVNNSNVFKKFEFIIHPQESEVLNVVLGLGSVKGEFKTNVAGSIYVDKITLETISDKDFENYNVNALEENIVGIKIGQINESNNDNDSNNKNNFQFFWWYFSSIVLGLTIIIVLVTLAVKKFDWKKMFHKDPQVLAEYDTRRIENEQKALAKKELRARKRAAKKNQNKKLGK